MSATVDHVPRKKVLKNIPSSLKMIAAIISPIIITVTALAIYGNHIRNEERIYPNISIAGIEVSGMTRTEALNSLGLPAYEERSANAKVTFVFPDGSESVITGNDAMLQHNARDIVNEAYQVGRGRDVLLDAVSYLRRHSADEISYDIEFLLDEAVLTNFVTNFTGEYNRILNASAPIIYEDRIVFTKGAGHVNADVDVINDLAYIGLFQSLEEGHPVEIVYSLPDDKNFVFDIFDTRDDVFVQMLSSEYDLETNSATISAIGVTFDVVEAARLISEVETGETATIPLVFAHPDYSQEYLESLLFRDLLGERTTWAHGNSNRLNNIQLSSEAIDGLILLPGEEFSFNRVVGARTLERGYMYAPALSQGETIMSVGGGVCQTSSTIFAAIRTTDIQITEQRRHGKPVPYLPWGHDATVFFPYIDFRFVNNTDYPMRLEVELDERNITARVYGTIKDDFPVAAS